MEAIQPNEKCLEGLKKIKEYPSLSIFVAELLWYGFENNLCYWDNLPSILTSIKNEMPCDDEEYECEDTDEWCLFYDHFLNFKQGFTALDYFTEKTEDNYFLRLIESKAEAEFNQYKKSDYIDFLEDTSDFSRDKIETLDQDFDANAFERFVYELIFELEEKYR